MKDYSEYSNAELFEIENYLDPFKYENQIEEIRKEIDLRKNRGEISAKLVPTIDWEPLKFWKKEKKSAEFAQQKLAHSGNY